MLSATGRVAFAVADAVCLVLLLRAQANPQDEASPAMELKLEGTQTPQGFPSLRIHLTRHGEDAGFVRVRFPEGIDANRSGDGKHLKFYQDLRSPAWPAELETEPVKLPVEWTGDEQDTRYVMEFDNGMLLRARARAEDRRVVLSYELQNGTDVDLANVTIWSCVQLMHSPPLADFLMERTGVLVEEEFRLFRDLVPGFTPYSREQAQYQRFAGYPPGRVSGGPNPEVKPHPGFPDDRGKDNYFWYAPQPIEAEAIATLSRDGTWAVATVGKGANSVWTNPGISCQHADPAGGPCGPGATVSVTNSIHVIEGGEEAVTAFLRELAQGR
jgi:hypothetical protein